MKLSRRALFGLAAGAVAAPVVAKLPVDRPWVWKDLRPKITVRTGLIPESWKKYVTRWERRGVVIREVDDLNEDA
jgi:hypothetical protein